MPNFREHLRGGVANAPIENGGEMHLPCVVLVDTSGSMDSSINQLREGLRELADSLNDQQKGIVEFCIIGFDDDARILVPFGPVYDFEVPKFECGGMTAMHSAVELGLNELDARKRQYKENRTAYYRPWMFMLTDGGANDGNNGSFERLLQYQDEKHCTFYSVAVGESVDRDLLKSLRRDGMILTASKENFKDAFVWLGNSLSVVSSSTPGQKVKLPNPSEYQLEVEV